MTQQIDGVKTKEKYLKRRKKREEIECNAIFIVLLVFTLTFILESVIENRVALPEVTLHG